MNILIVDDIEENVYLLETLLSNKGYEIKTARNGFEALKELKKDLIDLIISDILMPKMDGFQLCRECKKDEKLKNIPFLFYTATYTEKKDEEFALGLGAAKFIIKPQEPDTLLKILKDFSKEHRKKVNIVSKKKTADEVTYLSEYSKIIIKKLEKKIIDLNMEITIRKQAEEKLAISNERLALAQKSAGAGMWEWDMNIGKLNWSPELYNLFGLDPNKDTASFDNWHRVLHPEDRQRAEEKLNKSIKEKKPLFNEYRIVLPSGKISWINVLGNTAYDEHGKAVRMSGICIDVTEKVSSEEKLEKSYKKLKETFDGTIKTLASVVETKDPYTSGHQDRVAKLSVAIAKELKLDNEIIDEINKAATIHDIGKIIVPQSILSKPSVLSDIEFSLIKTHCQAGYDILKNIDFGYPIADIVMQHHERENGSGYPKGLIDSDIMLEAKIIAVADVVEAMSSHRPYRPALGIKKALEEIESNKNILYDSVVANVCIKIIKNKNFEFQ